MRRENQRKVKYLAAIEPPIDDEGEEQMRMFFHTPSYDRRDLKEAPDSDDVNVFHLRYDGVKGRGAQSHLGSEAFFVYTGGLHRIQHRKWRETKPQPST